jgi:hypothetical protein
MRTMLKFAMLMIAATLVACTTAPIYNVANAAVVSTGGKTVTDEQVKAAIVRAGSALGWQIRDAGPGKLVGNISLRAHTAEVEIPYSTGSYSILYKSSTNLNEGGGQIHKNYNGWIQNLHKGINTQLALL